MEALSQNATHARCDAYIISHRNGQDVTEYLVRPSFVVLNGNGSRKFRIRNLTGNPNISVDLQGEEDSDAGPRVREVDGQYDAFELTVKKRDGHFEYKVTVGTIPARGDSDPVIIIDPPGN